MQALRIDLKAGSQASEVAHIGDAQLVKLVRADGGHGDGHLLQAFLAPLRRHYDVGQLPLNRSL